MTKDSRFEAPAYDIKMSLRTMWEEEPFGHWLGDTLVPDFPPTQLFLDSSNPFIRSSFCQGSSSGRMIKGHSGAAGKFLCLYFHLACKQLRAYLPRSCWNSWQIHSVWLPIFWTWSSPLPDSFLSVLTNDVTIFFQFSFFQKHTSVTTDV